MTRDLDAQSFLFQVAASAPVSLQNVVSEGLPFVPLAAAECVGFLDTPIRFTEAHSTVLDGHGLQLCKAIDQTTCLAALSGRTTRTPVSLKDLCAGGLPGVMFGAAKCIEGDQFGVGLGQALATLLSGCGA